MYQDNLSNKHKLAIHFIVFSLLMIFIGKSFFVKSNYFLLYLYGVSVTFVLLLTFFMAIFKYKDPSVSAEKILEKKMGKDPLVSCMVAVFNEEKIIGQCITSLMRQDYKNKEIIFVNDKSTDGTAKILDKYATGGE